MGVNRHPGRCCRLNSYPGEIYTIDFVLQVKYIGKNLQATFGTVSQKLLFILLFWTAALVISSCGTVSRMPKQEPEPPAEVTFPDESARGKKIEEGRASWYGPKFHGKLTANGERYDMHRLTAAHRTLPFNSIVKVHNLDNGEEVMVRINDRGPFAKNRIIDLSKKAAREIDMIGSGTAPVALILMSGNLSGSKTTNLKTATYTVQLGSFEKESKAFEQSRRIKGSRVVPAEMDRQRVYRVYYGTYLDKSEALIQKVELKKQGFNGYVKQIQN